MPDDDNQGNIASRVAQKATEKGREVLSNVDLKKSTLESYGRRSRNQFRRITSDLNFTNILTKFPVVTVVVCLLVTGFFSWESGLVDCRDGFCPIEGKSSMNVNGYLEVYLPGDSEVTALIAEVEKNWTTNVMVIYVESYAIEDEPLSGRNITSVPVLEEIEQLENLLNPEQNDGGADNVIYVLSISTVIKEVNSSAGRVVKSFFSGVSQAIGNEEISEQVNQTIDENQDALGNYAIPDE